MAKHCKSQVYFSDYQQCSVAAGGYDKIVEHCKKLEKRHAVHIAAYGEGNERRLTGKHEACSTS